MTIFKQYKELINGQKTQTRRLRKMAHVHVSTERAAVPGRGKPAWWVGDDFFGYLTYIKNPREWVCMSINESPNYVTASIANAYLKKKCPRMTQVRVRYTRIWQERLQNISPEDALAEGVNSIEEYAKLWDSINKAKGTRWADNPLVWCYEFERTPQLVEVLRGREVAL